MTTVDKPRTSASIALRVAGVIEETADSCSVVFHVPDETDGAFDYRPGQFLTLRIPSDRTGSVARCYSLASSPFTDEHPKVTVKRTADGYGSNWICDNVRIGDVLEVLPPSGAFTPKNLDDNFLLFAGGSGITPVISILKSALTQGNGKVALVYANRDEKSVIFADELRELAAAQPKRLLIFHLLQSEQGLPNAVRMATLIAPFEGYESFLCGPAPFMDAAREALNLLGVPRSRIHAEAFNSLAGDPFSPIPVVDLGADDADDDAATLEVELDGESHHLTWPRARTLVDIMLAQGLDVPYSCREGECGSCACRVVEGDVVMDNCRVLDPDDIDSGYILACQSRPSTDHVKIEF